MYYLKYLREELWHKTSFDTNHVPTPECIEYRTLNSMYYIHLHRQCQLIQAPLDPLYYGWRKRDDKMEHIEDSVENIKERNTYLRKIKHKCGCEHSQELYNQERTKHHSPKE